jgi:hypothetical protein
MIINKEAVRRFFHSKKLRVTAAALNEINTVVEQYLERCVDFTREKEMTTVMEETASEAGE